MAFSHIPVLLNETLAGLNINPDGIYVDATFGRGGHSREILKRLSNENKISKKDLYELKESDVISIIENSKYNNIFNIWKNAKKVKISKEEPKDVYYVHHGAKVRYIDPLFNGKRISKCCKIANKLIENNLAYDMSNYVYLDFNFND